MIEYTVKVSEDKTEWYLNGIEYTESEFNKRMNPKELTVAEIEKLLGYTVKIVK